MKSYFKFICFTAILSCGLIQASNCCLTQTETKSKLTIGIGVSYTGLPYDQIDNDDVTLIPYIRYQADRFYIDGTTFGYSLISKDEGNFGYFVDAIGFTRVGFGYQSEDSPVLTGMGDRDDLSLELGVMMGVYGKYGLLTLSVQQDVVTAHEGLFGEVRYSLPWESKQKVVKLEPYIGVNYQSTRFNNYYYGVRPSEVTANRSVYPGRVSTNFFVGFNLEYKFTTHLSLVTNFQYEVLDSSITDSPIVGQDYILSGVFGIAYTF